MTKEEKKAEARKKLSALLNELKQDYLSKLPERIVLLKQLTEQKDWSKLEQEYHKLKGTGKTYGMPEISSVCLKMEALAQQGAGLDLEIFHQAVTLIEKIHAAYRRGETFDLQSDDFARRLLAPTAK